MKSRPRIALFAKYGRKGASSRLRSLQYLPELKAAGIDIVVNSLFDDRYLDVLYSEGRRPRLRSILAYFRRFYFLLFSFRYDLIWIEKELFPYFPPFAELLLRVSGKPYVVDYDDAVFHNYDLSNSALVKRLLGKKIDAVMQNASCVVAGNEYLAERAKTAGAQKVEVIPTVVDVRRYRPRAIKTEGTTPVIGWIGSPSTQGYVVDIRNALIQVCRNHEAKLVLVGATDDIKAQFLGIDITIEPWSEEGEVELIRSMDVGIMPLKDGPWERGKCGYKLIQYMACAVPVVASPVGVNVQIVSDASCGGLAATDEDWVEELDRLLASELLRYEAGANGRAAVEKVYSMQSQLPNLEGVFLRHSS